MFFFRTPPIFLLFHNNLDSLALDVKFGKPQSSSDSADIARSKEPDDRAARGNPNLRQRMQSD